MYLLQRAGPVHCSTAALSATPARTFVTEEKVARRSFPGDLGLLTITLICYLSLTLVLHSGKSPSRGQFVAEKRVAGRASVGGDILDEKLMTLSFVDDQ